MDVVQTDLIHTLIYLKISIAQLHVYYNPTDSYLYYILRRIAFLYFYTRPRNRVAVVYM